MMSNKRVRPQFLDDDSLGDVDSIFKKARMEAEAPERETVSYKEINHLQCDECFGCKYFSEYNFKNEYFGQRLMQLFQIFSNNRLNLPSKAIAMQMKRFFDKVVMPKLPDEMKQEWSLDSIEEHINKHGFFPTSEIVEQITAYKNFRIMIQDLIWEKDTEGKMFINVNYAKLLMLINKQIVLLLEKQKNITDMIGYNKILKF